MSGIVTSKESLELSELSEVINCNQLQALRSSITFSCVLGAAFAKAHVSCWAIVLHVHGQDRLQARLLCQHLFWQVLLKYCLIRGKGEMRKAPA